MKLLLAFATFFATVAAFAQPQLNERQCRFEQDRIEHLERMAPDMAVTIQRMKEEKAEPKWDAVTPWNGEADLQALEKEHTMALQEIETLKADIAQNCKKQ